MTPARARLLAELLQELRSTSGEFIPDEAWERFHTCLPFAVPYVDLLVFDRGHDQIFLTQRASDDREFPGQPWHTPGGLWRASQSLEAVVASIALRELGVEAKPIGLPRAYRYAANPRGQVISHFVEVHLTGEPQRGGAWFGLTSLPPNLVPCQVEFFATYLLVDALIR